MAQSRSRRARPRTWTERAAAGSRASGEEGAGPLPATCRPRAGFRGIEGAEPLASPNVLLWVCWLSHLTVAQASPVDALEAAVETHDSAVHVLGDGTLREVARELAAGTGWTLRDNIRATTYGEGVKRILRKHGSLPASARWRRERRSNKPRVPTAGVGLGRRNRSRRTGRSPCSTVFPSVHAQKCRPPPSHSVRRLPAHICISEVIREPTR